MVELAYMCEIDLMRACAVNDRRNYDEDGDGDNGNGAIGVNERSVRWPVEVLLAGVPKVEEQEA